MKNTICRIFCVLFIIATLTAFAACGQQESQIEIAIPNDTTNEARALLLLEQLGMIKLREGAGITATVLDIEENPRQIRFREVEAAQIPNILQDVDFAVINSNYAIAAGMNPKLQALGLESGYSAYSNVLAVKAGNEENPLVKALVAALKSQRVADYITSQYGGAVISAVDQTTDGYDATVDYVSLSGQTISVAASPAPHAEILEIAKAILAEKNITLDIQVYTNYVTPNEVVEDGTCLANYFQHIPYMEDFNQNKKTHIVSVAKIHVEPLGIYGGRQTDLKTLLP